MDNQHYTFGVAIDGTRVEVPYEHYDRLAYIAGASPPGDTQVAERMALHFALATLRSAAERLGLCVDLVRLVVPSASGG